MDKSPEAFRTISEVAEVLQTPAHVLRFWESRFPQVRPVKRAGGRRYYRPTDVALLAGIKRLLHDEGMTIRGVQKILREQGIRHVAGLHGDHPADDTSPEEAALEAAMIGRFDAEPLASPESAAEHTARALRAALEAPGGEGAAAPGRARIIPFPAEAIDSRQPSFPGFEPPEPAPDLADLVESDPRAGAGPEEAPAGHEAASEPAEAPVGAPEEIARDLSSDTSESAPDAPADREGGMPAPSGQDRAERVAEEGAAARADADPAGMEHAGTKHAGQAPGQDDRAAGAPVGADPTDENLDHEDPAEDGPAVAALKGADDGNMFLREGIAEESPVSDATSPAETASETAAEHTLREETSQEEEAVGESAPQEETLRARPPEDDPAQDQAAPAEAIPEDTEAKDSGAGDSGPDGIEPVSSDPAAALPSDSVPVPAPDLTPELTPELAPEPAHSPAARLRALPPGALSAHEAEALAARISALRARLAAPFSAP